MLLFTLPGLADAGPSTRERLARLVRDVPGAEVAEAGPNSARILVHADGRVAGSVILTGTPSELAPSQVTTRSFYVYAGAGMADPPIVERLIHIAHLVANADDGSLGYERHPPTPAFPWGLVIATGLAVLAAVIAGFARRGQVLLDFRIPHAVPAAIQAILFLYWSLYWPGVAARMPSILLQLALAYALDAAVMLGRFRVWKVGFGPLPIILSANLFAWFAVPGTLVLVGAAILSRAFFRRGTRHIFNPSAFGLAVAGALSLKFRLFYFDSTFTALNMAPNIAEILLILALIPQIRFRIVLVTLVAAVALQFSSRFFYDVPGLTFPGTLLTFTLFITDPATTPQTTAGKILFGAFVGFTIGMSATLLNMTSHDDDLAKVFPVPFANALVSVFDRIGARLEANLLPLARPRWNLVHLALWATVVLPSLWEYKPRLFEAANHWTYRTPGIAYGAGEVPRCEDNPLFCRPFSFVRELSFWAGHPPARQPIHLPEGA